MAEPTSDPRAEQVLERAAEQHSEALHHDHDVPRHLRQLEAEFRAALVERAEEQGGEADAERMIAPHQRDGDAHESVARGEIEQQPVLRAHELVDLDYNNKGTTE